MFLFPREGMKLIKEEIPIGAKLFLFRRESMKLIKEELRAKQSDSIRAVAQSEFHVTSLSGVGYYQESDVIGGNRRRLAELNRSLLEFLRIRLPLAPILNHLRSRVHE